MNYKLNLSISLLTALTIAGCQDHQIPSAPPQLNVTTLASNLASPISVESDGKGRVFVIEQGTGKNDGRLSEITPDGKVYPIITGFHSEVFQGSELSGPDHILYANGWLYILTDKGLYTINVAAIKTGSPAIDASTLTPEFIQQWVINHNFTNDTGESHLYNMVMGPDGALYITDAAANAIIRRSSTGALSVMAEVPSVANPNPAGPPPGPPFIQAVPTGITFDGTNFRISTLIGFPFPVGTAVIYKMDLSGNLSVYQKGFTSLVDIENDGNGQSLVLRHGVFGAMGFGANTGQLIRANGTTSTVLLDNLNLPTDLKMSDSHTAYLTSLGNGTVSKITF
ncbi:ScyD/ScyE family protein [Spirosoma sp. KNUC1025]|uniref:ScyD/ScyE family protein n=1 Tax=Spirosoma sp. KNUC1025 TaxID=2894082 RepID=UPI00386537D6|nr:ScyD/ScyE family protein [Spirosoma sp. KNUC1025]